MSISGYVLVYFTLCVYICVLPLSIRLRVRDFKAYVLYANYSLRQLKLNVFLRVQQIGVTSNLR